MKKKITSVVLKVLVVLVVCLACIITVNPSSSQAATKKQNMKSVIKKLEGFEYWLFFDGMDLEAGESRKISLNSTIKMKAAAVSYDLTSTGYIQMDEDGNEYSYSYSLDDIKKECETIFGKSYGIKSFPVIAKENLAWGDLYRKNGNVYQYVCMYETDVECEVRKTTVKGNYVTDYIFFGYWGNNDGELVNYAVRYHLKANKNSKYGYVVDGIKVTKLVDEWAIEE